MKAIVSTTCMPCGRVLPASNGTTRVRFVSLLEGPIATSPLDIFNLESAQIQTLLRLIQRQDVDGEELMDLALELIFPVTPAMDPAVGAEVFVDILRSHLVILDLGLGARRDQLEVFRRDSYGRVALFQADGAVTSRGDWRVRDGQCCRVLNEATMTGSIERLFGWDWDGHDGLYATTLFVGVV